MELDTIEINKEKLIDRYTQEKARLLGNITQAIGMLNRLTESARGTGIDELNWKNPKKDISDGYHTFNELYHHRKVLTKVIAQSYPDKCVKSWKHDDGSMFNDSFIVVFDTPKGQYSYHYKSIFWDDFDIKEVPYAPKYDGHNPSDVARLESLLES